MSSSTGTEAPTKFSDFFSLEWVLTVPNRPSVRYFRATPAHFDIWFALATNPENNEEQDTKGKVYDEAAIAEWKNDKENSFIKANKEYHALEVLIEFDGQVIGYGGIWVLKEGLANIGIVLNKDARGLGLGKLSVTVLAQICFDCGMSPTAGTMKSNQAMRAVMASVGAAEKEQIVDIPGRGIVAELGYSIERETWKDIDIKTSTEGVSETKQ
jgi:RimJ/RimL family protein N-acetyltransferase